MNIIKTKNNIKKYQQTINSFHNLYRKSLQDNVIDENEYESQCNLFIGYLDATKNETFFINMKMKNV